MNRFAIIALFTALSIGCSTISMPKGSSRNYKSARLVVTSHTTTTDDPEDSPALHRAVQEALAAEFKANNLEVGNPNADLIVAYMIIRQTNSQTAVNKDYFGDGRDPDAIMVEAHNRGTIKNTAPDAFKRGAIVIDVLDAKTNKLVYRGFAKRNSIEGISATEHRQRVSQAVAEALTPFFR